MFRYYFRCQPSETSRASNDSSLYQCCSLTTCQNVRIGRACRSSRQRRRQDCAASLSANRTHENGNVSYLPIPRIESRSRASRECCSITKKNRQSYTQRGIHLHVVRPSTYLWAGRFPRAVVFSCKKTVFTHISCRDGALVNTKLFL